MFYRDRTGRFSPSSVKSSLLNRVSGTSLFPYLGGGTTKGRGQTSRWSWEESERRVQPGRLGSFPPRPLQSSPLSGDQVEVVAQGGVVAAQLLRRGVFPRSLGFDGIGVHQRSQAGEQD